ncbi:unnamed protein product [Rotaria sordida]|uniref:beta-mannosidase n=2 Tax=Rotaria sordida TaxID=392033 RepID=A0A819SGV2_9BILA|nr:unnamed protein product [Rotaria sordida]
MTYQGFSVFIYLSFIFLFSGSNSTRITLTGDNWLVSNGSTLRATGAVPGTIHTILLSAKMIDDPYWGFGDTSMRSLIYQSWTFTKNFSLQVDFLNLTQFTLHFDQIDTVSNITLNECFLGNTSSMFIAYTFSVQRTCLHTDNVLRVEFMSPVTYALNQAISYNKTVQPTCPSSVQHGECHVQFIRKEPCSFSWDWGPAFAPIGITGNVYLEGINSSVPPLQLDSVNVISQSSATKVWQVDVRLSGGDNTTMYKFDFQLKNTAWSFNTTVRFNQKITITLSVPDKHVQLWWPNGQGDQPLYELIVSNNNQSIDSRFIGFRTVELVQSNYSDGINGTSFYFRINSRPIFIKGSNWIPSDSFQERVTNEKLEQLLTSAKLANMNMLRIWGGGIYERDYFYEIADRLGIMLWHDFMFACSLYPVDDAFLLNVRNEILYQVERLQSHPSIVLWAGNNENEMILAYYTKIIPPEEREPLRNDYRKLYIYTIMAAVAEVDPNGSRPFVPSSPSNGLESAKENYTAQNPQDPLFGDVHYYNYFMDTWKPDNYPIVRFMSETGVESMPSIETWQQVSNSTKDWNFRSALVQNREHHGNGQEEMMLQIERNLPLPVTNNTLTKFTQLIYLTQINQAMTLKTVSDHCRLNSPVDMINPNTSQGNTMGLMYWQLNDIWQAPTWSSIEYELKWKMAHYYARHMYSPGYLVMKLTPYLSSVNDPTARLWLYYVNEFVNSTLNDVICTVNSLDKFDSRMIMTYTVSTGSPGVELVDVWIYALLMEQSGCSTSNQCLMLCSLCYLGDQPCEQQTIFFARPKDYQLYNPNLRTISIRQRSSTEIDFTINADNPALFVWLDLSNGVSGYFSSNGFHMFEPEITVTFKSWTSLTNIDSANFDLRITSLYDVTKP